MIAMMLPMLQAALKQGLTLQDVIAALQQSASKQGGAPPPQAAPQQNSPLLQTLRQGMGQ
jgi:hypothetical protein